jgi:hypothetical protein
MKTSTFLQAAILIAIIALAASCRTSRSYPDYPTSRRYPYPEERGYPYPDDRRVVITNDPNPSNLPPGQAKKIYGGKSARPYAPGQRKKQYDYNYRRVPLIINRTPDIVIGRNRDGRYYHRSSDGYTYWQGYDNRYYLDDQYVGKVKYDDNEYSDWYKKGKDKTQNNNGQGKGKSNGNGNRGRGHH